MCKHRLAVVVNPRGGKQYGLNVLESVKTILTEKGKELDVMITQHPGHAGEMARSLELDRYDGICVIGGDGTVHEVADGLMQRGEPVNIPLGLIPAGTGNTLHQHLQCNDPLVAARHIAQGITQPFDVIKVTMNDQVVFCIDLVGWGALADINIISEKLRFLGRSRYTLAALGHILRAKPRRAKLILDERIIEDEFLMVAACNTKFAGPGMKLAPHAELGDGKIDVVVLRRANRRQMLKMFAKVFDGSHLGLDYVEYHQVTSFAIESDGHEPLDLDGEIKGHASFAAEVLPGMLRVFG